MIYEIVYSIFLDGNFIGICEDEDCVWEIAQNETNGTPYPLTDDNFCDRVQYYQIDVNRYVCNHNQYTTDKLSDDSFLCRNIEECKKAVKQLNALQLEKERAEAKLRAMAL